jgi:hypothetical protein
MCRSFTFRRRSSWRRLLPCITIFDDPKKLAQLNAEVERRKLGLSKLIGIPGGSMAEHTERWMQLCELATQEEDPRKLIELTNEITRLLDEKRRPFTSVPENAPELT